MLATCQIEYTTSKVGTCRNSDMLSRMPTADCRTATCGLPRCARPGSAAGECAALGTGKSAPAAAPCASPACDRTRAVGRAALMRPPTLPADMGTYPLHGGVAKGVEPLCKTSAKGEVCCRVHRSHQRAGRTHAQVGAGSQSQSRRAACRPAARSHQPLAIHRLHHDHMPALRGCASMHAVRNSDFRSACCCRERCGTTCSVEGKVAGHRHAGTAGVEATLSPAPMLCLLPDGG